jgi:hypothetical protein
VKKRRHFEPAVEKYNDIATSKAWFMLKAKRFVLFLSKEN